MASMLAMQLMHTELIARKLKCQVAQMPIMFTILMIMAMMMTMMVTMMMTMVTAVAEQ